MGIGEFYSIKKNHVVEGMLLRKGGKNVGEVEMNLKCNIGKIRRQATAGAVSTLLLLAAIIQTVASGFDPIAYNVDVFF